MQNARWKHRQLNVILRVGVGFAALVMLVPISGYALDHYRLKRIQQVWYLESDADGGQQVVYTDGRHNPL